ncbi:hypothetical protein [Nitrososphaera sp.]|uniref:hypothetical protein n=1 Tax=Nitrososphaera sp. TaxID=1971748 RepID=UPI002ED9E111
MERPIQAEEEQRRKSRTEGITFRLDENVIRALRKQAEQKQVSVNTLAAQIFNSHLDWNANAGRAGMVSFPKSLLIRLVEGHSNERIIEIAKYMAQKEVADIILLLRNNYTPETFLDVVESWAEASGFPFNHHVERDRHVYVIQHDMGDGWSLYLAKVFEYVFEEIGTKKPEIKVTNNTFVLKTEL